MLGKQEKQINTLVSTVTILSQLCYTTISLLTSAN